MIDQEHFGAPSHWQADAADQALLDAQRTALLLASTPSIRQPKVGDVWLSSALWSGSMEHAMTAMLIVLRTFTVAWSIRPLFDVAPVSDDERLASEWSLLFGASYSGIGFPIIAHIDAQCTTSSSMLVRFVGALSDVARSDLSTVLRAYALNDDSGVELTIGRRGSVSIRFHPEWEEFARDVVALCHVFSSAAERERARGGAATVERQEEAADDDRVLAVASGVQEAASDLYDAAPDGDQSDRVADLQVTQAAPIAASKSVVAYLKDRSGARLEGLAVGLGVPAAFLTDISDHATAVPEGARLELARRVRKKWGIAEAETLLVFKTSTAAPMRRAASRKKAFSVSLTTFAVMVQRSTLSDDEKRFWLSLA